MGTAAPREMSSRETPRATLRGVAWLETSSELVLDRGCPISTDCCDEAASVIDDVTPDAGLNTRSLLYVPV